MWNFISQHKGFDTFLMIALVVIGSFVLTGCTSAPSTALYQAIGSDRAAVTAATTLYKDGLINKSDGQTIYTGAAATSVALKTWDAAIASKDSTAITNATNAATTGITNLLNQLYTFESNSADIQRKTARVGYYRLPAGTEKISPGDVITIVQLAVQLAPEIQGWVNTMFNKQTVTEVEITQALSDLDSSLADLRTALTDPVPAPGTNPTTQPAGVLR